MVLQAIALLQRRDDSSRGARGGFIAQGHEALVDESARTLPEERATISSIFSMKASEQRALVTCS
jgi:hypothetical protein